MTDTECMCVLQGKSLSKDTSDVVFTTSRTTKGEWPLFAANQHTCTIFFGTGTHCSMTKSPTKISTFYVPEIGNTLGKNKVQLIIKLR